MKAWRLEKLGGRLSLEDIPVPEPRPGSVLVRVEASALMSYLKAYVEGKLPFYNPPAAPFTIGTNAIGTVEAVGRDVWTLKPGQRVVVSSHFAARENVDDPPQVLIGLTASPDAGPMLADWPDGTLAGYVLAPVDAVTPTRRARRSRRRSSRKHQPLHCSLRRAHSRAPRGGRDAGRQRRDRRLWDGRRAARRRDGSRARHRRRTQRFRARRLSPRSPGRASGRSR